MDSSPPRKSSRLPSIVGVKRSAPLLPPFEPTSSPPLPRPLKRRARTGKDDVSNYPTPIPTSSTAILSSSPSRAVAARPSLKRTHSMTSERAPLSAVPCIMVPENGEPLTMGRSSASCSYQLSANRLISRVHVKVTYKPSPSPFYRDKIEVLCTGWNGIKLHCQGKTYELAKGKTFTSDIRDADIMIDVQDARVLVQWPRLERKDSASTISDHTWEESSPIRSNIRSTTHVLSTGSPIKSRVRPVSPVSPSPAVQALGPATPLTPSRSSLSGAVVVYEDAPSPTTSNHAATIPNSGSQSTELASDPQLGNVGTSFPSSLPKSDDLSDHDEENDPIIMSFGPYGDNILPRMASFHTGDSPILPPRFTRPKRPTTPTHTSPRKKLASPNMEAIKNHIANQLAFSRLSSTPFSTIISHLPAELVGSDSPTKPKVSNDTIRQIIEDIACVGKISREGKDAAGKPLETEYYYTPDSDTDEMRKQAVVNDLRKPGLRNCRKQHRQYFWKRPKTP